jgi:hypothetical protein
MVNGAAADFSGCHRSQRLAQDRDIPIGLFGALLPGLALPPLYLLVIRNYLSEEISHVSSGSLIFNYFTAMAVYYLAWKHIVRFLNRVVGLGR